MKYEAYILDQETIGAPRMTSKTIGTFDTLNDTMKAIVNEALRQVRNGERLNEPWFTNSNGFSPNLYYYATVQYNGKGDVYNVESGTLTTTLSVCQDDARALHKSVTAEYTVYAFEDRDAYLAYIDPDNNPTDDQFLYNFSVTPADLIAPARHYVVADRETNNYQLDWYDSVEEATEAIRQEEATDKINGNYVPNSYEILVTECEFKLDNLTDDEIVDRIRP